jgi:hypothetical protein
MAISLEEQRQIENEMNFRRVNELNCADLDKLDELLIAEGNSHLIRDDVLPLYFLCECADENCIERIPLMLSLYQKIHNNRTTFIVKNGHTVVRIEHNLVSRGEYTIVRKKNSTAQPKPKLNRTNTNIIIPKF